MRRASNQGSRTRPSFTRRAKIGAIWLENSLDCSKSNKITKSWDAVGGKGLFPGSLIYTTVLLEMTSNSDPLKLLRFCKPSSITLETAIAIPRLTFCKRGAFLRPNYSVLFCTSVLLSFHQGSEQHSSHAIKQSALVPAVHLPAEALISRNIDIRFNIR